MEEPVRLACPRCDLVFRLKKFQPERTYSCKRCGAHLVNPDEAAAKRQDASARKTTSRSGRTRPLGAGSSDLSRLPKLVEELATRLETLDKLSIPGMEDAFKRLENLGEANRLLEERIAGLDARIESAVETNLRDFAESLEERLSSLDGKSEAEDVRSAVRELAERVGDLDTRFTHAVGGELYEKLGELKERLVGVAETFVDRAVTPDAIQMVRQELRATHEELLRRLDEHRTAQQSELRTLLEPSDTDQPTTVEVNIDELADRLVAGVRNHGKFLDTETGAAVDAMARLAEGLVKEQANSTARLDRLAAEIHTAAAGLSQLDEWRGELPERVADEIGRTVEARVVGPISGALARQAPSILSDLQDNKLVDIVSRSVREAQRPLLREILAGGRQGVPVWLFASVLLPLLLILGYLFLPGDLIGFDAGRSTVEADVADAVARLEVAGVPLSPDTEDRLRNIEDAVLDIHSEALVHVKNAASLEEEVKSLKATLAERDKLIRDYNETLQNQVKRIREYEMRLVQLGVSPRAIAEE